MVEEIRRSLTEVMGRGWEKLASSWQSSSSLLPLSVSSLTLEISTGCDWGEETVSTSSTESAEVRSRLASGAGVGTEPSKKRQWSDVAFGEEGEVILTGVWSTSGCSVTLYNGTTHQINHSEVQKCYFPLIFKHWKSSFYVRRSENTYTWCKRDMSRSRSS